MSLYPIIKQLLTDYENPDNLFYGAALAAAKKVPTNTIPTAGVCIKNKTITLLYNPEFVNKLSLQAQKELLIHEMGHVYHGHLLNNKKVTKKLNVAADLALWHNNKTLTEEVHKTFEGSLYPIKPETFELLEEETVDYYLKNLPKDNEDDSLDDHEVWEQSEGSETEMKEVIKDSIKDLKKHLKVPSDLQESVDNLFQTNKSWKNIITNFFNNSIKNESEKTRRKPNRRYGLLLKGKKITRTSEIAVIIDTSGSIDGEIANMFFSHINTIWKSTGCKIHIIQADAEVQHVSEYKGETSFEIHGRGGTMFDPAIDLVNKMQLDGVLYFTDGYGDVSVKCRHPFLWGVTDGGRIPDDQKSIEIR
jgi:predicted metal-dependent peptidase